MKLQYKIFFSYWKLILDRGVDSASTLSTPFLYSEKTNILSTYNKEYTASLQNKIGNRQEMQSCDRLVI